MSSPTTSLHPATLQFRQPGLEAGFRGASGQNGLVFDRWFYAVMLFYAVSWMANSSKQDLELAMVGHSNNCCPAALEPIVNAFGPVAAGVCSEYSIQAALVAVAYALLFCGITVRSFADVSAWCCPSFYVRHRDLIAIVSCSCDMLYWTMHRVVYCVYQTTEAGCSKTKFMDPMLAALVMLYRVPFRYVIPCFSTYCVTQLLLMQLESAATGHVYGTNSYAKAVFWQAVAPVVTSYVLQRRARLQYLQSTAQISAQHSATNGPAATKGLTESAAAKAATLLTDDDQASSSSSSATTPAWSGSGRIATAAAADMMAAAVASSGSRSGACLMYESPLVHQTIAVKIKSHSGAKEGDLTAAALAATIETVLAKLQYMSHASFVSMPVCVPSCTLFLGNIIGNAIQRQQQQGPHVPCVHDGTWNVLMRPSGSSSNSDSAVDSCQIVDGSSSTDPSNIPEAPLAAAAPRAPSCMLAFETYEDFQAAVKNGSLQVSIDQLLQQQPIVGSSSSTSMCVGSYAVAGAGHVLSCNLLTPATNHALGQQLIPAPSDSSSTSGSGGSTDGGGSRNGSKHGSSSSSSSDRAEVVEMATASTAGALHRVVVSQGGAAITDQHIQLHNTQQHPAQWEAWKLQLQLPCSTTPTTVNCKSRTSSSSNNDDPSDDCSIIQQLGTCTLYVSPPLQPLDTGQHGSKTQQERQHSAAAAAAAARSTPLAAVHVLLLPPSAAAELTSWLQQTGLSQQQVEPLLLDIKIAVDTAICACTLLATMAPSPPAATPPVAVAADSDLAVDVGPAVDQEKDRGGFVDWATAAAAASRAQSYLHNAQLHCCSSMLSTIASVINKACPAAHLEQTGVATMEEKAAGTAVTSRDAAAATLTAAAAATVAATTKVPAAAASATPAAAACDLDSNTTAPEASKPDACEAAGRHLPAAAAAPVDPSPQQPCLVVRLLLAVWCGLFGWWGVNRHRLVWPVWPVRLLLAVCWLGMSWWMLS